MLRDLVALAFSNVRHRGTRSWLTMLGIFLGIAAVVSLISLGQGLQQAITGQFATLDADKLIVENAGTGFGPPGSTVVSKLTSHDMELIEAVNGVAFVIPRHIRVVTVEFNDVSEFVGAVSIPDVNEQLDTVYDSLNANIAEGRLLKREDRKKVVLGSDLASEEDFDKKIIIGSRLVIQGEEFEVIGILEKSGSFFIDGTIFMPQEDLEAILGLDDEIDMLVVQIEEGEDIEEVAERIERRLRNDRNLDEGEENFSVQTPLQSLSGITTILTIINIVVGGIASISLVIGGVGIANTMFTSVLERRKEIGVMKAIGARNREIQILFLVEAGILGLAGGIIGIIIGLGLAFGVSSAAGSFLGGIDLQVSISYPLILAALAFSLGVGMIAGLLPAIQAAKLSPVEALRK